MAHAGEKSGKGGAKDGLAAREPSAKLGGRKTAARLVKPRSRARLREGVMAVIDAVPSPGDRANDVTLPRGAKLHDGEVLVLVASGERAVVTRVSSSEGALPSGFAEAELATLVTGLRGSFAAAARSSQRSPVSLAASAELSPADAALLARGGFDLSPVAEADDPYVRTRAEYAALIAESLDVTAAARLLDVEDSRVRQRLGGARPSLHGVKLGHAWRLPRWQFEGRAALPGLAEVLPSIAPAMHPVAVARWFHAPSADLAPPDDAPARPLSPREWLLAGYPAATVAELADGLTP